MTYFGNFGGHSGVLTLGLDHDFLIALIKAKKCERPNLLLFWGGGKRGQ